MSAPCSAAGYQGKRSWNCGSSAIDFGVLTGAIGKFFSSPRRSHSAEGRVRKISRSSRCISRLWRAWSAYFEPGQRSNRSGRPTHSQKFFQNACSEAEAFAALYWVSFGHPSAPPRQLGLALLLQVYEAAPDAVALGIGCPAGLPEMVPAGSVHEVEGGSFWSLMLKNPPIGSISEHRP